MYTKIPDVNSILERFLGGGFCYGKVSIFLFALILFAQVAAAQEQAPTQNTSKKIQLSGVVLDAESRQAIPFATIRTSNGFEGAVTDSTGFFNLNVAPGDTLSFTEVGYKDASFIVPGSMVGETYSMIKLLYSDTVILQEVTIYSMPDITQFTQAFLEFDPDQNDELRNTILAREKLYKNLESANPEHFYHHEQMRFQRMYMDPTSSLYNTTGLVPPNNLINPLAWSRFVEEWRKGDIRKSIDK